MVARDMSNADRSTSGQAISQLQSASKPACPIYPIFTIVSTASVTTGMPQLFDKRTGFFAMQLVILMSTYSF
jgi:hypothetical protein